jgi:ATP-dependent helicase HrpB
MQLPVDAIRETFEQTLATTDKPVIVTAPTGSGKSTRLPGWLAEHTAKKVMVVEPRRVACRSLATFLAKQAGEEVGQSVGYSIRFEDVRSKQTQVLFVTPGVALRMLADDDFGFGSVLIDEFHERGWEVDLIATILRAKRASGALDAPLVFTSATLDAESLAEELDALVLEASGRTFPVTIEYAEDGVMMPTREDLDARVTRAVRDIIARDKEEGEILVFLPGKGEISACAKRLAALKLPGVELLEVHASLPMHKLMRVFEEPVPGRRRIFLATNVAETSVTLTGVTWVIDSGLVRMQLHRAGRTALALVPTSEASMDQRAGRAGRVREGRCIRLWSRNWAPRAITPPEIERIELDDLLLRAAICGLDGKALEAAPWVTRPPEFALEGARKRLRKLRALDASDTLTERGARLSELPVSAHEARLLLDPPEELAGAVADLVAIMQRGTRLLLPPDRGRGSADKIIEARQALFEGVKDEVYEALIALRHGDPNRHALHGSALAETRRIAASLRGILGLDVLDPTTLSRGEQLPEREALAAYLLERAPEMGFVMRDRAQRRLGQADKKKRSSGHPWGNGQIELSVSPYRAHNEEDRVTEKEQPIAGLILDHTWLGDKKGYGVHGFGNMLLPCSLETMARFSECEVEVGELQLERKRGDVVIAARVERKLAGVTLSAKTEPLRGRELCEAAAQMTRDNRIFKGSWEKVLDALHLWDLLEQWEPTLETEHWDLRKLREQPAPSDPLVYLADCFEALGLRTSEEMALLEEEDLIPDIAGMSGIMAFELETLREDFPRIWEHLGAQYHCVVNVAARKVTLEPSNHHARKAKEPSRDVLPRFQGFRVAYRQASRVLMLRG